MTVNAIKGFQPTGFPAEIQINGVALGSMVPPFTASTTQRAADVVDVGYAISQAVLQRTTTGASTVTLTFADPFRYILRNRIFSYEDVLAYDGLNFTLVEFTKTSSQLQCVFEASGVADLRQKKGVIVYATNGTDLSGFAQQLINAVPGLTLKADPAPATVASQSSTGSFTTSGTAIGRGATDDPNEDSWTCLNRLASTVGWRCFECEGVIYLGPDPWLITMAGTPTNIEEFTDQVDNIDFTYDIGQPLGQMTATVNLPVGWGARPGSAVMPVNMGPYASGKAQLVTTCQRNAYSPQATITCQVPMTAAQVLSPTASSGIQNL